MVSRKKPESKLEHRWHISFITATMQKYLGAVDAPDERTALDAAIGEFNVPHVLRNKLVARRES